MDDSFDPLELEGDPYPDKDNPFEKALPHSAESERALVGSVLLDNGLAPQLIDLTRPEYFYVTSHRFVAEAIITLFQKGSLINPILLGEELKKQNRLQSVGGFAGLTNLTFGLPHTTNLSHYAKVVRGMFIKRSLMKAATLITAEVDESDNEPEVSLSYSQKLLFDISTENTIKSFQRIGTLATQRMDKAWHSHEMGTTLTGLDTGFIDINSMTLGLQNSDFIIVAARPSMGKTAYGTALAMNAAMAGANVAFFSLEMPEESIAMRMLCQRSNVNTMQFALGHLVTQDWHRLGDAVEFLNPLKIWVDDTPAITPLQLKSKAMRLAAEHGKLDLIIVDYLQLMTGTVLKKNESKQQEVSGISKELKGLAKEFGIPLVALSQLNRGPENRTDHRPQIADLRESGALEQDADIVKLLFRGDKYKSEAEVPDNILECNIAKHRNGPTGTVNLRFDAASTRIDNLAPV